MTDRAEHLERLYDQYKHAQNAIEPAWSAYQAAFAADDHTNDALTNIITAMGQLISTVAHIIDDDYPFDEAYSIVNFLEHHTAGGEDFTLLTFIEAYIKADDDHRSAHRLLLDAYQASMYDKPFDMEYHKNWVTRFKQWR